MAEPTVLPPAGSARSGSLGRWVLLAYRLPREPSNPRVGVWRKLERLGVARLGNGLVARLEPELERAVRELAEAAVEEGLELRQVDGGNGIKRLGENDCR